VRELQALVAPNPPQGVLKRGHADLAINKLSSMNDSLDPQAWEPEPELFRSCYLEKGIQTPMAQGQSTKIISTIK